MLIQVLAEGIREPIMALEVVDDWSIIKSTIEDIREQEAAKNESGRRIMIVMGFPLDTEFFTYSGIANTSRFIDDGFLPELGGYLDWGVAQLDDESQVELKIDLANGGLMLIGPDAPVDITETLEKIHQGSCDCDACNFSPEVLEQMRQDERDGAGSDDVIEHRFIIDQAAADEIGLWRCGREGCSICSAKRKAEEDREENVCPCGCGREDDWEGYRGLEVTYPDPAETEEKLAVRCLCGCEDEEEEQLSADQEAELRASLADIGVTYPEPKEATEPLVIPKIFKGSDLSENIYRDCGCWRCAEGIDMLRELWNKTNNTVQASSAETPMGWCGVGKSCPECGDDDISNELEGGTFVEHVVIDTRLALDTEKDVSYNANGERIEEPRIIEKTMKVRSPRMKQPIPPADSPFWDNEYVSDFIQIEEEPCCCCEDDEDDTVYDDGVYIESDDVSQTSFYRRTTTTTIERNDASNDLPTKIVTVIEHSEVSL